MTVGGWSAVQIVAGDGQGTGVFRVAGRATAPDGPREWSVILKLLPEGDQPASSWSHPAREALAYDCGLLEELPDGLSAPRCLGHDAAPDGHRLWLEDLGDGDGDWTLDDYATAARELGRFNGAYLTGHPIPDAPWLSRDWLRSWLDEGAAAVGELPAHRAHPLVRAVYPDELVHVLERLWARRDDVLAALERLPHVLCHFDAFRRNLFLRSGRLVAVDWAFLGVGPVGAELAPLVSASTAFAGIERASWGALERAAWEGYAGGLRDAGWDGPEEVVRFGFAASSALRYGPGVVRLLLPTLLDPSTQQRAEQLLGLPFDAIVDLWSAVGAEQARLAREALSLLPALARSA